MAGGMQDILYNADEEVAACDFTEEGYWAKAEEAIHDSLEQSRLVIEGVRKYQRLATNLEQPQYKDSKIVWQEGSSRLLQFTSRQPTKKPPLIFVPSLINRAYIFDLSSGYSIIRYLTELGIDCLLLDWGEPTEAEAGFTLDDYAGRLDKAVNITTGLYPDRKPALAGYCMGGMIALASALHNQEKIGGLVLLAAPWDFHEVGNIFSHTPSATKFTAKFFRTICDKSFAPSTNNPIAGAVSGSLIYQLFYMKNPFAVHKKYAIFAEAEDNSPEAGYFVERERWVLDGVPLVSKVAEECFINWATHNTPAKGKWQIYGRTISPEQLEISALAAIPQHDQVVPPASAQALVPLIKRCETLYPPSGHISLVVGKNAKNDLWIPLANWIERL